MNKNPIPVLSMDDVRANVLVALIAARDKPSPETVQLLVSISEYLKDAERWHWVRDNQGGIPEFATPQEVIEHVDVCRGFKNEW